MCNGQNSVEIAREHDKNIDVEESANQSQAEEEGSREEDRSEGTG